jgi:hypothetical protein
MAILVRTRERAGPTSEHAARRNNTSTYNTNIHRVAEQPTSRIHARAVPSVNFASDGFAERSMFIGTSVPAGLAARLFFVRLRQLIARCPSQSRRIRCISWPLRLPTAYRPDCRQLPCWSQKSLNTHHSPRQQRLLLPALHWQLFNVSCRVTVMCCARKGAYWCENEVA